MKRKQIIRTLIIFILGLIIGGISIHLIYSFNKGENLIHEEPQKLKESPYTLEEIYEIVENPERFLELTERGYTDFGYVILHFYEYFNEYTPFKCARIAEDDSIIEVSYVDYYRYMEVSTDFYTREKETLLYCEEHGKSKEECKTLDYESTAAHSVYGHSIINIDENL